MIHIDTSDVGVIRVDSLPEGEEPPEISRGWLGKAMPCIYRDDDSYVVFLEHALTALAEEDEALEYYLGLYDYEVDEYTLIGFNIGCAKEIIPVMTKEDFERQYQTLH